MRFFHSILCIGTPRNHNFFAHCPRASTQDAARAAAEPYRRLLRDQHPHVDSFLRVFEVVDGVGREVTCDPD